MTQAANAASELLRTLGHSTRLLILCRLAQAECPVGDIVAFLGIRDSSVSQHLALLRREGLVQARRGGQTIYYSLASAPARQVLETLCTIYCPPASQQR